MASSTPASATGDVVTSWTFGRYGPARRYAARFGGVGGGFRPVRRPGLSSGWGWRRCNERMRRNNAMACAIRPCPVARRSHGSQAVRLAPLARLTLGEIAKAEDRCDRLEVADRTPSMHRTAPFSAIAGHRMGDCDASASRKPERPIVDPSNHAPEPTYSAVRSDESLRSRSSRYPAHAPARHRAIGSRSMHRQQAIGDGATNAFAHRSRNGPLRFRCQTLLVGPCDPGSLGLTLISRRPSGFPGSHGPSEAISIAAKVEEPVKGKTVDHALLMSRQPPVGRGNIGAGRKEPGRLPPSDAGGGHGD